MLSEESIRSRIEMIKEDNVRLSARTDLKYPEIQIHENRMMIGVLEWVLGGVA